MNDVNNRIFREFTEFFDNVEKSASDMKDLVEYDFIITESIMRERMQSA